MFELISGIGDKIGIDGDGAVANREIIVACGEHGVLGLAVDTVFKFNPETGLCSALSLIVQGCLI